MKRRSHAMVTRWIVVIVISVGALDGGVASAAAPAHVDFALVSAKAKVAEDLLVAEHSLIDSIPSTGAGLREHKLVLATERTILEEERLIDRIERGAQSVTRAPVSKRPTRS